MTPQTLPSSRFRYFSAFSRGILVVAASFELPTAATCNTFLLLECRLLRPWSQLQRSGEESGRAHAETSEIREHCKLILGRAKVQRLGSSRLTSYTTARARPFTTPPLYSSDNDSGQQRTRYEAHKSQKKSANGKTWTSRRRSACVAGCAGCTRGKGRAGAGGCCENRRRWAGHSLAAQTKSVGRKRR